MGKKGLIGLAIIIIILSIQTVNAEYPPTLEEIKQACHQRVLEIQKMPIQNLRDLGMHLVDDDLCIHVIIEAFNEKGITIR